MFHTNDDSKHEQWRALAREGDKIEAIKIYRSINGSSLMEAKNAVEAWIAAQPEGVCKSKILMSDEEALSLTLSMARTGAGYDTFGEEYRRAKKAIDRTEWLFQHTLNNDKTAKTGPSPPAYHSDKTGHHWLRNDNQHGGLGDIVVMQWQPEQQKWCHSGRVAAASAVDTVGWTYIAPCPMPLQEEAQEMLDRIHDTLANPFDLSEEDCQFLRQFLAEFRTSR